MAYISDRKKNSRALEREKNRKPIVTISMKIIRLTLSFIINECSFENKGFFKKIYQLFSTIDPKPFQDNHSLETCFNCILLMSGIIVKENVYDIELLMDKFIEKDINFNNAASDLDMCADIALDSATKEFIQREITERLNYVNTIPHIRKLRMQIEKFDSNNYTTFANAIEDVKKTTIELQRSMVNKNIIQSGRLSLPEVDFNDENFDEILDKVIQNRNNPKRFIRTGIKRFNTALGGGFQPGRVYVFIGLSGGFKSGIILNSALWAAKYNKDIICNDPSKKPMFLYLTQENDSEETLDRIFSYIRCVDDDKVKHTRTVREEMIKNDFISDSHAFRIIYRRKNEINANDIESIVREIESEGIYEVKFLAHDYLKRLRPISPSGDTRIDLGEATNDLSELSKLLKIPIVTGNQLNRAAYDTLLQEGKNEGKNDLGKKASLDMQSESQLITENADVVIAINREFKCNSDKNEWFLSFNRLKDRSSKKNESQRTKYFAVPFEENNSMRLMEDVNTKEDYSYDSIATRRIEQTNIYGYTPSEMETFKELKKLPLDERIKQGAGDIVLPGDRETANQMFNAKCGALPLNKEEREIIRIKQEAVALGLKLKIFDVNDPYDDESIYTVQYLQAQLDSFKAGKNGVVEAKPKPKRLPFLDDTEDDDQSFNELMKKKKVKKNDDYQGTNHLSRLHQQGQEPQIVENLFDD